MANVLLRFPTEVRPPQGADEDAIIEVEILSPIMARVVIDL